MGDKVGRIFSGRGLQRAYTIVWGNGPIEPHDTNVEMQYLIGTMRVISCMHRVSSEKLLTFINEHETKIVSRRVFLVDFTESGG